MMENVIVIICDSLSYEENLLDDMPNLKKYKDNMISFNNYFSQAPYTEAATVPIFSASNVTDYNGYFNNLKEKPLNINEIFKSLGYKTYNTLWSYPNTLSFMRGVDEYDYMDPSITYHMYVYRIKYFRKLYLNNKFNSENMKIMISLLDDFFNMTQIYINDYINYPYRFELVVKYTEFKGFDMDTFKKNELKNRTSYFKNKETYIRALFEKENDFFSDEAFKVTKSISFEGYSVKLNLLMMKLMLKQFYYNIKNSSKNKSLFTLKYTLKNIKNKNVTLNSIKRWAYYTIGYPGKYRYEFLSSKVLLNRAFDYLYNNKEQKNFLITHIMDTHTPFNFFSSESENVDKEFENFLAYSKTFNKNKNNFYRYSKLYIDNQIGDLLKKLENNSMIENTTIIITSDHGSSFLGEINRTEITSTFYDENYKIPFIILNKKIKQNNINNLSISTQFIPTILDFLKVPDKDNWIKNKSIFNNNNPYIIFEYFGPGCPDYINREKLFCIRSEHYKVQYKVYPEDKKEIDEVIAIYDILKDPKELNDIKDVMLENDDIKDLIFALKLRINNTKLCDN